MLSPRTYCNTEICRWKVTTISAQRQWHRKKGKRLIQQRKWKDAELPVKGQSQKCAQKALGIAQVKALVPVYVQ